MKPTGQVSTWPTSTAGPTTAGGEVMGFGAHSRWGGSSFDEKHLAIDRSFSDAQGWRSGLYEQRFGSPTWIATGGPTSVPARARRSTALGDTRPRTADVI